MRAIAILVGAAMLLVSSAQAQVSGRLMIDPATTSAGYQVGETFINRNNQVAVAIGTTNSVSGDIFFDPQAPQDAMLGPIIVDLSTLTSDEQRRDNTIRSRWLQSNRFPSAVFTTQTIEGLPDRYLEGDDLTLLVHGELIVREVARPTTLEVSVSYQDGTLSGVATAEVLMTDFGFDPPAIFGILRAENEVLIEIVFRAVAAAE